jgi:ABC-type nitrate/sulfonate/bicarbonate transport system substrate-binding protein
VNTDWAAKNRNAVVAFTHCHLRAIEWMYKPDNKAEAIALIIKNTKADPRDSEQAYDYLIKDLKAFSRGGLLTEEMFGRMKAGLIEMGDVKEPAPPLDRFFDASYVKAASAK